MLAVTLFAFSTFFCISQENSYEELRNQDWPNLKKYQESNQLIIDSDEFPEVVFMGNSITESWAHIHPDFFTSNHYVNRGIGGQSTPQMLIRFKADVIHLKPKIVVILAGTNDIAMNTGFASEQMIVDNITSMAELATSYGIKVILCSILPVYDYPWRPGLQPAEKIISINKQLRSYSVTNQHVYLDYHTPMANELKGMKSELTTDGVHVSEQGYELMEEIVLEAINYLKQGE